MDEEVRRVSDALDAIEAIEDTEARVRAMNRAMSEQSRRVSAWKAERGDLVRRLRSEGVSYRQIATRLGTSLGTVQDIVRGHSGSWSDRRSQSDSGD